MRSEKTSGDDKPKSETEGPLNERKSIIRVVAHNREAPNSAAAAKPFLNIFNQWSFYRQGTN